jgi:hypothetical protein
MKPFIIWKSRIFIIITANLFLWGCGERYIKSEKICDGKFYIEFYTEWSDMGKCYLTDSVNFRVKIDRFNVESEYHYYQCKSDSIIIEKWSKDELNPKHILETKKFSFKKLIQEGNLGK